MPHKRAKKSTRDAEQAKKGYNLAPTAASSRNDTPRNAARILNSIAAREAFRARGGKGGEDLSDGPRKRAKTGSGAGTASSSSKSSNGAKGDGNPGVKDKGNGKGKGKEEIPSILPHESLADYNRRVESLLRGGVSAAIKSAAAIQAEHVRAAKAEKAARKRKAQGLDNGEGEGSDDAGRAKDAGKGTGEGKGKGKLRAGKDEDGDHLEPENRPVVTFKPAPGPRRLNDVAQAPPSLPRLKRADGPGKGAGAGVAAKGGKGPGAFSSLGRDPLNAGQKRLLEEERERVVKEYRRIKEDRERKRVEEGKAGKAMKAGGGDGD